MIFFSKTKGFAYLQGVPKVLRLFTKDCSVKSEKESIMLKKQKYFSLFLSAVVISMYRKNKVFFKSAIYGNNFQ